MKVSLFTPLKIALLFEEAGLGPFGERLLKFSSTSISEELIEFAHPLRGLKTIEGGGRILSKGYTFLADHCFPKAF